MSERLRYMLFALALALLLTGIRATDSLRRPEVFWPKGETTAWCYWADQDRQDLVCFAGPRMPDPSELVPWTE